MGTPWFRTKRYGFGASLPIAWQGWALMAAEIGIIVAAARTRRDHPALSDIVMVATLVAGLLVAIAKSDRPWRWRWGGRD